MVEDQDLLYCSWYDVCDLQIAESKQIMEHSISICRSKIDWSMGRKDAFSGDA